MAAGRERTKTEKRHEVPLSLLAIEILEDAKLHVPDSAVYVFTTLGDTPFSGFSVAKRRLDRDMVRARQENGMDDAFPEWRIHDLRRTAASGMASLGIAPHVIERVLNHSTGIVSGVAAVYNRYDYKEEMEQGLEKWSRKISQIIY